MVGGQGAAACAETSLCHFLPVTLGRSLLSLPHFPPVSNRLIIVSASWELLRAEQTQTESLEPRTGLSKLSLLLPRAPVCHAQPEP